MYNDSAAWVSPAGGGNTPAWLQPTTNASLMFARRASPAPLPSANPISLTIVKGTLHPLILPIMALPNPTSVPCSYKLSSPHTIWTWRYIQDPLYSILLCSSLTTFFFFINNFYYKSQFFYCLVTFLARPDLQLRTCKKGKFKFCDVVTSDPPAENCTFLYFCDQNTGSFFAITLFETESHWLWKLNRTDNGVVT